MAWMLPIKAVGSSGPISGLTTYYVPLNGNERLDVIDTDGTTPIEALNVPDVAASLGGQLKVVLEDGTSYVPVAYRGGSVVPPTVTLLDVGAGEAAAGRAVRRSEVVAG